MDKRELIEVLVVRAKDGEVEATEEIIRLLKDSIGYHARRAFIDGYDYDDLVSEGFKAVLNAIDKYDCSQNKVFYYYAMKSVTFRFKYLYRSYKRKKGEEEVVSLTDQMTDILESKEESVDEKIYLTTVMEAIKKLPEEEREIIEDVYFKETSMSKIARNKGLKISRVQYLRNKALERLRVMV